MTTTKRLIIKMGVPVCKLTKDEYNKITTNFWISGAGLMEFSVKCAIGCNKQGIYIED